MLINYILSICLIYSVSFATAKECYANPCTRDVIIVIDGSTGMKNTNYTTDEINLLLSLTSGWVLSDAGLRVALMGVSFTNEVIPYAYNTDYSKLQSQLVELRTKSTKYGLSNGYFWETITILMDSYTKPTAPYQARVPMMKRIILFSTFNNRSDIQSQIPAVQKIKDAGFALSIVGIDVKESLYQGVPYHKFYEMTLSELAHYKKSLLDDIINDAICQWDNDWPTTPAQICTTSTLKPTTSTTSKPTTLKTAKPTPTPRPIPPGDYMNCSCNMGTLWIDIVFVVDTSGSMEEDSLVNVKSDIFTIIVGMNFDKSNQMHTRAGLVTFNSEATVAIELGAYDDAVDFAMAMFDDKIASTDIDELNFNEALLLAEDELRKEGGNGRASEGVRQVIVLYSTTYTDIGDDSGVRASHQIKTNGIHIITIGVIERGDDPKIVEGLAKLSSPWMSFDNSNPQTLVSGVQNAMCQVNCFCPLDYEQLVIDDWKFGECYNLDVVETNRMIASKTCGEFHDGLLALINSEEKSKRLQKLAVTIWKKNGKKGPLEYFIGLQYDTKSESYIWDGGITNLNFTEWDDDYPNLQNGSCVASVLDYIGEMKWRNVNCLTYNSYPMCQVGTCDSERFCTPGLQAAKNRRSSNE